MGSTEQKLEGPDFAAGVPAAEIVEGKPVRGHFAGEPVMVVRVGRELHAIGANCTHYGGPLNEGLVVGHTVRCPWHHACFDVRNGSALGGPALNDLPCYDVRAEGQLVKLTGKTSSDDDHEDANDGASPGSSPTRSSSSARARRARRARRCCGTKGTENRSR